MAGMFACPECGEELMVDGLSPGREILCESCSTWVEVPYLPRAGASRRTVPRSPWDSPLLKVAIAFAVVAILGLIAVRMIVGQVRSGKERVLATLVDSAREAEAEHRYDQAIIDIQGALKQGRSMGIESSARFEELVELRDKIAFKELEFRLAGLDALGTDQAIGEALTLAEKVHANPRLDSFASTIDARLVALRLRQAQADLATAKQAFNEDRDADAFAVAARLHDRAGDLSRSDASKFQAEARTIIEAAVSRKGVAVPPVVGRFVAGSAEAYTRALDRSRVENLRARGYLPEPRNSTWSTLWDEQAPFRATVTIVETQEEFYLQSRNRTTQVDGTFELLRGDRPVWRKQIVARTRVPLPDLPALLGGHLATADKRNPETERRLHDDAMKQFVEQAGKNLRGVPSREAALKVK